MHSYVTWSSVDQSPGRRGLARKAGSRTLAVQRRPWRACDSALSVEHQMEDDLDQTLATARENLRAGRSVKDGIDRKRWRALLERYSRFVDRRDANGYLIASEAVLNSLHTPRPCLHLMASTHSDEFGVWGSFWDQIGGGFSCLGSVLAGKMTSHLDSNYVPTAPEPQDVRRFFIRHEGNAWPMFPVSFLDESAYTKCRCVQGLDRHVMRAQREHLISELEVCVHPSLPLETWTVRITNVGDRGLAFSWFTSVRVDIGSFPAYYFVPRVVCEGLSEHGALVFMNHDRNNKHPRHAFFTAEPGFDAFDMTGETFNGASGRSAIPAAVLEGRCRNSPGRQPYAGLVAAAQFDTTLEPGETGQWVCAYGACPYEEAERKRYLRRVRSEVLLSGSGPAAAIREIWARRTAAHMAKTPSPGLDRYFNVWSKYQARNQARFCRALDKVGYRDVLQDLIAVCECEPEHVRERLLHTLRYQSEDGRAVRQYEACRGAGHDMRMYMDSSSWIPDTLVRYLEESGDFAVLDEQVPFFDLAKQQPDESRSGTVYEHALRAVRSLARATGYHGLCRIGYGDWNDALSGIGGEEGVSVWLSCACVHAAQRMEELATRLNRAGDAADMRETSQTMTGRINEHAWDGEWYIYAINGRRRPIGSRQCAQGRIHLNVNTWALFTGVARAAGRERQVWQAIARLATPVGHMLLAPPYTSRSRSDVGRIADQKPGMFENGSIYLHGEAFYLYALIVDRQGEACYRALMQTLPSEMVQDIATGPRHQQSNFTVGPDHPDYGSQLFSNFTGSVSWYRRVIERMLGVTAGFDTLRIDPCPPDHWDEYEVRKIWRGRSICAHFLRAGSPGCRIAMNAQTYEGCIPLASLAETGVNHVEVEFA